MVFGFGSSSSSSSSSKPEEANTAPTREQRAKCWATRDEYFACLDRNGVIQPGDGELGDKKGACKIERTQYEGSCGRSWIDYFNKRRMLEIRQQKTIEAAERAREDAAKGR